MVRGCERVRGDEESLEKGKGGMRGRCGWGFLWVGVLVECGGDGDVDEKGWDEYSVDGGRGDV